MLIYRKKHENQGNNMVNMVNKGFKFQLKAVDETNRNWVKSFIKTRWGSEKIVYNGKISLPHRLSGFIVLREKEIIGLITYKKNINHLQIITIDSLIEGKGVGIMLIEKVKKEAESLGYKKIKVRTTNDNLNVLRFYQKRGFKITKIYKGAVDKSRKIKPEIPLVGENGIPLCDEIELELRIS